MGVGVSSEELTKEQREALRCPRPGRHFPAPANVKGEVFTLPRMLADALEEYFTNFATEAMKSAAALTQVEWEPFDGSNGVFSGRFLLRVVMVTDDLLPKVAKLLNQAAEKQAAKAGGKL